MAKLIIDEKEHGIHAFIIQLRSLVNHSILPGNFQKLSCSQTEMPVFERKLSFIIKLFFCKKDILKIQKLTFH